MTDVKKKPRKRPGQAVRKKKAPPPKPIAVIRTETVPVKSLQIYHKNPNVGDVTEIAKSIEANGLFRPICVNIGTFTGRKNEILAGNHTYLGVRKLGRSEVLASFVDVDEEQAAKIVIADNRTGELGSRDEKVLAELFATLDTYTGTGYSDEAISAIMQDAEEATRNVLTGLEEEEEEERARTRSESFEGTGLGEDDDDDYEDGTADESSTNIARNSEEELPGLAELKEVLPEGSKYQIGYWQIPALRKDMLMTPEEMPEGIDSWAGSACKDWPNDDQWWLYNWGVDSTSGMKDVSKVIVSFYCWDDYFENWFWNPKKYVTKLLNSGIKYMVTPNYSMWTNVSRFMNVWAMYRSRYVGRYAQEAGIKIVPDLIWPEGDKDLLTKHVLPTLPKDLPMISHQLQTNSGELLNSDGDPLSKETAKNYVDEMQISLDTLKPKGLLFYSTDAGLKWFNDNIDYEGEVFYIETRLKKLAESRKRVDRKKTI